MGAVVGTVWELIGGIATGKADELRRLGVAPTAGVLINLAYSTVAVALFCWLARRWSVLRATRRFADGTSPVDGVRT